MRRALASLLLATISFPLIAGTLFADLESKVPACCRRNGAHHCSMTGQPAQRGGFHGPADFASGQVRVMAEGRDPVHEFRKRSTGGRISGGRTGCKLDRLQIDRV
jgi:hypothetical protein